MAPAVFGSSESKMFQLLPVSRNEDVSKKKSFSTVFRMVSKLKPFTIVLRTMESSSGGERAWEPRATHGSAFDVISRANDDGALEVAAAGSIVVAEGASCRVAELLCDIGSKGIQKSSDGAAVFFRLVFTVAYVLVGVDKDARGAMVSRKQAVSARREHAGHVMSDAVNPGQQVSRRSISGVVSIVSSVSNVVVSAPLDKSETSTKMLGPWPHYPRY
jgi:hypothetical protein